MNIFFEEKFPHFMKAEIILSIRIPIFWEIYMHQNHPLVLTSSSLIYHSTYFSKGLGNFDDTCDTFFDNAGIIFGLFVENVFKGL